MDDLLTYYQRMDKLAAKDYYKEVSKNTERFLFIIFMFRILMISKLHGYIDCGKTFILLKQNENVFSTYFKL